MNENETQGNGDPIASLTEAPHVAGMYKDWFLDYASYVILERAVPYIEDGLKPVQRRILHSLWELEDGRYNKVANVVGHTMKYHPHGDASIYEAIVQLGQRELLLDTQGNWGNILTGDSAAAARYIEARLSKFALEVLFNRKTTVWQPSYDGRNQEPVMLPAKFPLLLAQGVEGIAVGLACKILPHNFNELIDASIAVLKGRKPKIVPDFPTGGIADFGEYQDGLRGGRIRIRARIEERSRNLLVVTEVPFGTTTLSLMDSILAANAKEKIKVKKIEDNTAEKAEILIHLPPGSDIEKTISALYVFTDCETSIAPNSCVIVDGKPLFLGVSEILRRCTDQTVALLKLELEIRLQELEDTWHFSSLEKIFIEKKIYTRIEQAETWEAVLSEIDIGLRPYKKLFRREITRDDLIRLTEIKIKRISKYNKFQADEQIKATEAEMKEVKHHLAHLVDYAIAYYAALKKKYGGPARKRRTEVSSFGAIKATEVARAHLKLYVNRDEGFAGYGMRKDEFVADCSDLDEVIVFSKNGTVRVSRVAEKAFFEKEILHIAVFKRDDPTVYNLVYQDGKTKRSFVKRFQIGGVTRDKVYELTQGNKGSNIQYLAAHPGGECEIVQALLKPNQGARKTEIEFDFATLAVKNRGSRGNELSKYVVRRVKQLKPARLVESAAPAAEQQDLVE